MVQVIFYGKPGCQGNARQVRALIRRPLLDAAGERHAGWEPDRVANWIGLGAAMPPGKEGCAAAAAVAAPAATPPGAMGRRSPRP